MDGSPIPVWQVALAAFLSLLGAVALYPRQPFTGNFGIVFAAVAVVPFAILLIAHAKQGPA